MNYNAIKQKIILLTKTPNLLIIGILILLFASRIISSSNENEITVNLTDPTEVEIPIGNETVMPIESNIVYNTEKTMQNTSNSMPEVESGVVTESTLNHEAQLVYSQELDKTFDIAAFSNLSKDELMTFPGIGEVTAQKILDYVAEFGAFQNFEELMEVKGIGEKKLQKILATFP